MSQLNTGTWRTYCPVTDLEKCIHCMMCWIDCPDSSILVQDGKKVGTDMQYCKGCGVCANVCPVELHRNAAGERYPRRREERITAMAERMALNGERFGGLRPEADQPRRRRRLPHHPADGDDAQVRRLRRRRRGGHRVRPRRERAQRHERRGRRRRGRRAHLHRHQRQRPGADVGDPLHRRLLPLPIVMPVVNRALCGPINIHCDHSDAMGARDSGWIQLFGENCQEAYDNALQAVRIAEHADVRLPVMVCLDGFILSHTLEALDVLDDEQACKFVGPYKRPEQPAGHRAPRDLRRLALRLLLRAQAAAAGRHGRRPRRGRARSARNSASSPAAATASSRPTAARTPTWSSSASAPRRARPRTSPTTCARRRRQVRRAQDPRASGPSRSTPLREALRRRARRRRDGPRDLLRPGRPGLPRGPLRPLRLGRPDAELHLRPGRTRLSLDDTKDIFRALVEPPRRAARASRSLRRRARVGPGSAANTNITR